MKRHSTANIRMPEGVLYPARGVHANSTLIEGKRYGEHNQRRDKPYLNGNRIVSRRMYAVLKGTCTTALSGWSLLINEGGKTV